MHNQVMEYFKDKTLLISGGTGSFGNAVLKRFLETDIAEIRVFSRDEKKQDDMRLKYNNPKLKFILGDVRNLQSVESALRGVDFVFHAAALKQVPSCEFFPMEAVKTNITGTENMVNAVINKNVKRMIMLSTDKAVYPINAMGMSKAMAEKVVIASSRSLNNGTTLNVTRYGNVMASRGSVIPLFVSQAKAGRDITITDPTMTRFLMSLDDAVDLVLYAFLNGRQGDTFIQKAPASTIEDLAKAVIEIFNPAAKIRTIGTRHGEKRHETLLTREEFIRAEDLGNYYRIPSDNRDLNYDSFFNQGEHKINTELDYTSENTTRLDIEGVKKLLLSLDFVKYQLEGQAGDERGLV
jgi:UDP-N-acetylglucosamine 4,6-dehydratase/5-epimerase